MMNNNEDIREVLWKAAVGFFSMLLALFIMLVVLAVVGGCSPKVVTQIVEKEKVVYRDSTIWRDTIIRYPIPLEKDQAIVHVGDTSHRETSLAFSDAWVGLDGMLYHSIENKRGSLYLPISIPKRIIMDKATSNKAEIITRTVEVEKPLTWWQRLRIGAFWWLLGGLAAALGWIFKEPLKNIICKLA